MEARYTNKTYVSLKNFLVVSNKLSETLVKKDQHFLNFKSVIAL